MNLLRRFVVFMASAFLPSALFLLAGSAIMWTLVGSPTRIETWIADSGAYDRIVSVVLEETQHATKDSQTGEVSLSDEGVKRVASQAFAPTYLQKQTENVLDGTYAWLRGDVNSPSFSINVASAKTDLGNGLADYAISRLKSLPTCDPKVVVTSEVDVFSATCIPRDFDIQKAADRVRADIVSSDEFLGDTTIDAGELGRNTEGKSFFDRADYLPTWYQRLRLLPWIIGGITLALMAIIIAGHADWRRGIRRVSTVLVTVGVVVIIGALLSSSANNFIKNHASPNKEQGAVFLQKVVLPLLDTVTQGLRKTTLVFGITYTVLGGAGLLFYFIRLGGRRGREAAMVPPEELPPPEPAPEARREKPHTSAKTDKPAEEQQEDKPRSRLVQ